jgi:hypothetical protein
MWGSDDCVDQAEDQIKDTGMDARDWIALAQVKAIQEQTLMLERLLGGTR